MPRFQNVIVTPGFDIGSASGLLVTPQGAFTTNSLPLRRLVAFAYALQDSEILGPESLDSHRYSIKAQAEEVPDLPGEIDQFRLMVRELLAERFGLKFHWLTERSKAWALLRDENTPQLKPATASEAGPLLRMNGTNSISIINAPLESLFTSWLSACLGAPVIDRTGLSGNYTFDLKWESDATETESDDRARSEVEEPSAEALGNALRTELGLKLEAIEAEIKRMVVDSVDRPNDLEADPVEVEIDTEVLERYVGSYSFSGASIMSISRDGTRLLSQLPGQPPVEMYPASETQFFSKLIPARLEFVLGNDGKVTALVLSQGGREARARRMDATEA